MTKQPLLTSTQIYWESQKQQNVWNTLWTGIHKKKNLQSNFSLKIKYFKVSKLGQKYMKIDFSQVIFTDKSWWTWQICQEMDFIQLRHACD